MRPQVYTALLRSMVLMLVAIFFELRLAPNWANVCVTAAAVFWAIAGVQQWKSQRATP